VFSFALIFAFILKNKRLVKIMCVFGDKIFNLYCLVFITFFVFLHCKLLLDKIVDQYFFCAKFL